MNSWKIGALVVAAIALVMVSGCKKDEAAADAGTPAATTGTTGTTGSATPPATTGGTAATTGGTTTGATTGK